MSRKEGEMAIDSTQERQLEKLRRDLGPEFLKALTDPETVEIVLNADGFLWQERLGEPMRLIGNMTASLRASAIASGNACGKIEGIIEGD
jgi:hypothetical protein